MAFGLAVIGLLAIYLVWVAWRASSATADRTAEMRTVSNAVLDAVIMMDASGRVVHWNPAAERIFGFTRAEIMGRVIHQTLVPPEYLDEADRGMRQFMETGLGPVVGKIRELEALRKDGTRLPIEISVSPFRLSGKWWAVAIVRDITDRKRHEKELNREKRLLADMLDLQERDRMLTAYEIHDGLAQQLAGAVLKLQAFRELRQQDAQRADALFDEALQLLGDGLAEARRLISGLRPPVLDELGVVAAVDHLVSQQRKPGGPEIEFRHEVRFDRLAAPLESAIFRIVQESLTNALRHSQSERILVELAQPDDRVRITVRDWGVGFDPREVDKSRFGLRGIQERARLLGGAARIESQPDQGASVTVELPLVEPAHNGTASENDA